MEGTSKSYEEQIANFNEKTLAGVETFLNTEWLAWEESKDFKLVYRDEKTGFRSIKSEITINRDMKTVYDYIDKFDNKYKYDKSFESGYEWKQINENFSISYLKYKGLFLISPRDFVNLVYKQYGEDHSRLVISALKEDDLPEVKGVVRAEVIYGGFLMDAISTNSTKLTFFSCADLKLNQTLVNTTLKDVAYCVKVIKKLIEG